MWVEKIGSKVLNIQLLDVRQQKMKPLANKVFSASVILCFAYDCCSPCCTPFDIFLLVGMFLSVMIPGSCCALHFGSTCILHDFLFV